MKANIFIAVATAFVICSCGSSKKVTTADSSYNSRLQNEKFEAKAETPNRKLREEEPCQALAAEREFAAAGTATSYTEKVARNEAIRDARYELGRMMQVAVEGAAEDYLRNASKNKKSTAETLSEEINNQFFAECVKNSKVIKTTTYDLSDGQIQVYACVEVVADFSVLDKIAEIADNTLSRDETLEIEFDKEQFKKKVSNGLKEYKENRNK